MAFRDTASKDQGQTRMDGRAEKADSDLFYSPRSGTRTQILRDIGRGRVCPLVDVLFKFLFGRPDRSELFLDLLNALVFPDGERAFSSVSFINNELSPLRASGKGSRLDIAARLDGELVNLEVQVRPDPDYLKRTLYYWALLYSATLERGADYTETVRTISLNLLDFELFPEERGCRNSYSIRNDASGRRLCEDLQIVYFELPKDRMERRAGRRPRNKLERWLGYLDGMRGDEMGRIAEEEPRIGEALLLEREFFQDRDQRLAYIVDLMNHWDEDRYRERLEAAALAKGRAEGEAKGRAEGEAKGRAEGRADTARRMLAHGLSSEQIAEYTGLSLDEVESLRDARP